MAMTNDEIWDTYEPNLRLNETVIVSKRLIDDCVEQFFGAYIRPDTIRILTDYVFSQAKLDQMYAKKA